MAKSNKNQFGKISAKRALLRLGKSKGSVLFLVVAIMSVMVILASAVYYSVTSARKQVELKYDSEQSYQSALALNDMLSDYIGIKTNDSLVVSIIGLNENDELVTTSDDGTGFSELTGGLGDFKVTVKKLKGNAGDSVHILEIKTEVEVGGEKSVVTTIGEFSLQAKAYTFDRFFTSTGYAPNDVILNGIKSKSTMYLDNEFTQLGSSAGGDLTVNGEIISAGTVAFYNPTMFQAENDVTIGNNAYFFSMNGDFKLGTARVGGSVVIPSGLNQNLVNTATLYILEDFFFGNKSGGKKYVNGDLVWDGQNPPEGSLYVNGDMFIDSERNITQIPEVYVGGNIYIYSDSNPVENNNILNGKVKSLGGKIYNLKNSTVYNQDFTSSQFTTETFDATKMSFKVESSGCESLDSMRSKMDYVEQFCGSLGGGYTYIWPSSDDTSGCESIAMVTAMIDEKLGNPSYINWNAESLFIETVEENGVLVKQYKDDESIQYIDMDVASDEVKVIKPYKYVTDELGNPQKVIANKVVIDDISFGGGKCGLVFDTSDGEGGYKDIYVYLEPNCYNAEGSAAISDAGALGNNSFMWNKNSVDSKAQILTTGKGSVIFVVPDGVKYIQNGSSFIGHIGIFEKANGTTVTITTDANGENVYKLNRDSALAGGDFATKLVGDYKNPNYNIIGEDGRLTEAVINEGIAKGYYTHNNVFLVTISKNAKMDFTAAQNQCCAFIYAPYMTYDPSGLFGSSENGMLGGMIVSDYMMAPNNNYYFGTVPYDYYDRFVTATSEEKKEEERAKYMEKLMNDSGFNTLLESSTTKSWKKYGYN